MDNIELKNFKHQDDDNGINSSIYHEEINTLRIDKLSNRVTIISVIIPCIIGAILVFAYLDMKEKVIDVDVNKQNQVERISEQFENKLNALGIKIAKNTYEFENNVPELKKHITSIEGQLAKLSTSKADKTQTDKSISKINKKIANNANQYKTTLQTIERVNKQTVAIIEENENRFQNDLKLLEEDLNSKLAMLSELEDRVALLRKDTSLIDKRQKDLEKNRIKLADIEQELLQIESIFNKKIEDLKERIDKDISQIKSASNTKPPAVETPPKKTPPTIKPKITIETPTPGEINEESLVE